VEKRNVIWTARARYQLESIYKFIAKDSMIQADKVFDKIKISIENIPANTERHPPDRFKRNNKDNKYRAFEIYRYRISYRVTKNTIYIVRIRSTDQNP